MSKSVLLLGNINSPLLKELVDHLRKHTGQSIHRLDIISYQKPNRASELFDHVYAENVSTVRKVPILNSIYRWFQLRSLLKKANFEYDVCHIHSVNFIYSFLTKYLERRSDRLVVTYWGSDFFRASKRKKALHGNLLKKANFVTATNTKLLDQLKTYFQLPADRLKLCRFGLTPLEEIRKMVDRSREQLMRELELPKGELIITCGYNASDKQYHEQILDQIHSIASEIPENTLLILPMTYAGDQRYVEQVRQKAERLPFQFRLYETFLAPRENAMLRMVSDIMIQVQPTDQFSGSMQEYMFANNYVITGSWLPYEDLQQQGAFFKQIDSKTEIGAAIQDYLENKEIYREKLVGNAEVIWKLSSWESNIKSWLSLYTSE